MGIFTNNQTNKEAIEAQKPLVSPEETTAEVKKEVPVDTDFVDRSLYDCDNCGGEGVVLDEGNHKHVLCPQCNGKGKLN